MGTANPSDRMRLGYAGPTQGGYATYGANVYQTRNARRGDTATRR